MNGDEVRDLRRRGGWTQAQLADRLGTDPVTVSRWERGASHPRRAALDQLSRLFVNLGPKGTVPFVENATERIRKLGRTIWEQQEFKRRVRFL